ncbi:transcriptional regulator (plasmid) [Azospirillum humicireducens]|uniref:Transcriptional regulator n=1 Tax=Azospirillum humicireducens TaxID=1226968 RepID=A0A2R4VXR8_9PROT|nr:MerR family DNA-binding transcriptional regulator [Azospirillum humicireducens]AWB09258.1 transcriptional regulator [Azospirillum humicireducens]
MDRIADGMASMDTEESGRAEGPGCDPRLGIGDLAGEFGLTHRTIRHYEDEGLLSPERIGSARGGVHGGARIYSHRDRARLALICRGKRLGFSLAEIKDFLNLYDSGDAQIEQMRYMRTIARRRISALEQQLADVKQTLAELCTIDTQISEHLRRNGITETQDMEEKHS